MWENLPPLVRVAHSIYLPAVELAVDRRGVFDYSCQHGIRSTNHHATDARNNSRHRIDGDGNSLCSADGEGRSVTQQHRPSSAMALFSSSSSSSVKSVETIAAAHYAVSASAKLLREGNDAECRAVLQAFEARYRAYTKLKNDFTDAYLGEIERAVDGYLMRYFQGDGEAGWTQVSEVAATRKTSASSGGSVPDRAALREINIAAREWSSAALSGITRAGAKLLHMRDSLLQRRAGVDEGGAWDGTQHNNAPAASHTEHPRVNTDRSSGSTNGNDAPVTTIGSGSRANDVVATNRNDADRLDEAAMVCRLRYTVNVISARYLDEPPSAAALQCVSVNYQIITFVLRHSVPPSAAEATTTLSSSSPATSSLSLCGNHQSDHWLHGACSTVCSATSSRSDGNIGNTKTTPMQSSASQDLAASLHVREKLILPTITRVWRHYLTPLQGKAEELCQIAERHILPSMNASCEAKACDFGTMNNTTHANSSPAADSVAREVWQRLSQRVTALNRDVEYLRTIHGLDESYVTDQAAKWCVGGRRGGVHGQNGGGNDGSSADSNHTTPTSRGVADYIPVHGLVLSRLHRLEVEHRSVLELWFSRTL